MDAFFWFLCIMAGLYVSLWGWSFALEIRDAREGSRLRESFSHYENDRNMHGP